MTMPYLTTWTPCRNCGVTMDTSRRVWIGHDGFYCTAQCAHEKEGGK